MNPDPLKLKYIENLKDFSEKSERMENKKEVETALGSLQIYKPNFYIFIEQAGKNYELDM